MELVPISVALEFEQESTGGRSKAVHSLADKLKTTVATIYRWEKSGDVFVVDEKDLGCTTVLKIIKCI